jgi:Asparagine synthase
LLRDNDVASMASSLEQWVPPVDQVLFESVDRLPDQARYLPLGRKAMLRRIGLRGLDPALFERPKSGFVLPFDRWIRRWARPRGGGAALAGLPRWGTRHVLVAGLVGLRLHPMAPPQPRLPLRRPSRASRAPSAPRHMLRASVRNLATRYYAVG